MQATPLVLAGLAVALPYQAGLFNIGAQSQFIGGAIVATYLGYGVNLPPVIHVIVCVSGSFAGGAAIGWLVGELKARTGAHEVIVTIMLNYIMAYFLAYLLSYHYLIQAPVNCDPITSPIASDARTCRCCSGTHLRINAGFSGSRWPARPAFGGCWSAPPSGSSSAVSARTPARRGWRA